MMVIEGTGYEKVRWDDIDLGQIVYIEDRGSVAGPFYVRSKEMRWITNGKGQTRTHMSNLLVKIGRGRQ